MTGLEFLAEMIIAGAFGFVLSMLIVALFGEDW